MCEFPLETGHADYLLFVDQKAAGIIEAKAEGTPLGGVAEQSENTSRAYRLTPFVVHILQNSNPVRASQAIFG